MASVLQYIQLSPRMCKMVTVLSLYVSQSFIHSTAQQKVDLEEGSLPKIKTSIKILHWTF